MNLTRLFKEFIDSERSGGIVLVCCTIVSLIIANSSIGGAYTDMWHAKAGGMSMEHWINDGLMAIFFLLIGLEIEREIYIGELSDIKDALLPLFAAVGGMIVPAGIYLAFNYGTATQQGAGIPMATDIAFALGILSLLGKRVPLSLRVFLTALAIIDDLGAIVVIALFYSKGLVVGNLLASLGIFLVLNILNRMKVKNLIPYIFGGILMWYFMLHSGIHATITGVLLAFAIPFGDGGEKSPSYRVQHFLHKPVAFFILPVFALANTAIHLSSDLAETISQNYSLGISFGLIAGKPIGIVLATLISVWIGFAKLPENLNMKIILGAGFLGGIGFTMSIFITLLAFGDDSIINNAKLIILLSSLIAGTFGFFFLKFTLRGTQTQE